MACLDEVVIARYVRGESPPAEQAAVREHLRGCIDCQKRVAEEQERVVSAFSGFETTSNVPTEPVPGVLAQSGGAPSVVPTGLTNEPPLTPAPAFERGATLGRYLVVDRLGEGGMGVVYAAYDPELNRKVAIKLLRAFRTADGGPNNEGQARLLREAQAMARVQHPNVISVYDVGTLGDRVFVAMEFVEGSTLSRWVREEPRPWREVIKAFLEAGKGLAAAHQAGLVHRDFKPENVLMGKDSRVRVMDFGLARLESSLTADTVPSGIPALKKVANSGPHLADAITQAGEVMGTPQYMSPEQRLGLVADARSDQFSFCAALFWALYREPPFDPMQLAAAAIEASEATTSNNPRPLNFTRTVIKEPPKEPAVPAWIKRAMLRGLELSPHARFPSMEALLHELGTDRWASRRRALAVAAGVLLTLGAAGLVTLQLSRRAQLCSGAEQELAGVWDAPTQRAIDSAFAATGKPYAVTSFASLKARLDDYSTRWVAMKREACEDTRVRGVQTEQLLVLRTICLDHRLKQMRALTRLLSSADAEAVEKAVDAARALPGLQHCADVEALTTPVSPPEDPAAREKLEKVSSILASAAALHDAGKYQEGLEVAQSAAAGAEELHYLPLQADALLLLGWLQVKTGDDKRGRDTLAQAVWTAEAARNDEAKAVAAIRLIYLTGYLEVHAEQAPTWANLARATLSRIGGNDDMQLELLTNLGAWYTRENRTAEAQDAYERAAALVQRAFDPSDPKRALALTSLGINYFHRGDNAKAQRVLLEALETIEKAQGPDHPSAAYAHKALAEVFREEENFSSALLHARRALEIWEAALGPRHQLVASAYETVAAILYRQAAFPDAAAHYRQALEMKLAALGPDHPDLAYALSGLGLSQVKLGMYNDAVPNLERALKLWRSDTDAAMTRFGLARALWETRRDRARARTLAAQARDSFEKMHDGTADEVAEWLEEHSAR